MAKIVPAKGRDAGTGDRLLEGEAVAVIVWLALVLKDVPALRVHLVALLEHPHRRAREREAEGALALHVRERNPGAPTLEIDAIPGELEHRPHAKAGEHGELGGELQVRRELALQALELGARQPARLEMPLAVHRDLGDVGQVVPLIARLTQDRAHDGHVAVDVGLS